MTAEGPEAVIFDCDGVLVDSERLANRILTQMLNELGWSISFEETVSRFKGLSYADTEAAIEAALGTRLPDDFMETEKQRCLEAFETDLDPVPGVEAVLRALHLPRCVASSSPPERLHPSLSLTGLAAYFDDHIYSATQVSRGKPHPDLFLLGASQLDVAPERCAVVEDSVPGVLAGKRAGMRVLGYADLTPAADLAGAGAEVFTDMRQLLSLVQRWA